MRAFSDPGLLRLRTATVTMAATLLSFGSVLALKHAVGLTTSSVLLAVVLSLSLNRQHSDRRPRNVRLWLVAPVLLPFLAVAAGEVGKRMFTHPDLGDTLFVVGMAGAIWLRRFGEIGRVAGRLVSVTLTATLITPGPVVPLGPSAPSRWWGAVVAVIAVAWVRLTWLLAERSGMLPSTLVAAEPPAAPARARQAGAPWHRRLPASTKMALQMAAGLTGAFAAGRAAFGIHWTWTVITAFIVSSGNRGRGDVAQKAVLRIGGALGGTLIATAVANAFPPHDNWSVVTIFSVLALALWLRPISYAFWAGGMTAALALLYGFYGERGAHLLFDRLEGILLGAVIAVAAAWLVLPIRNIDVIRRQLAIAFGEIATRVSGDGPEAWFPPDSVATVRAAAHTAELTASSVRWLRVLPARCRGGLPYAEATRAVAGCVSSLAALPGHRLPLSEEVRRQLTRDVTTARRALTGDATEEQVAELPAVVRRIAAALGG
ncbi:MAG TPA: FUSC family protein [Mycobacteriales bacterium]|jgi:hypothetical protein|nr:FUSC family protein [Mycobacteriales bacterium]